MKKLTLVSLILSMILISCKERGGSAYHAGI